MFQYMLVSILLAPVLIGVGVANRHGDARDRGVLRVSWIAYAFFWFALLYFLNYKWR